MRRRRFINLVREISASHFESGMTKEAFESRVRNDSRLMGFSEVLISLALQLALRWFMEWIMSQSVSVVFSECEWEEAVVIMGDQLDD